MLNLEVALSSLWQLARHWRQGEEAELELSWEDVNILIQLSASLGHPDKQHFPDPLPSSKSKEPKKKSPSQLRRQERRQEEARAQADKAVTNHQPVEEILQHNNSDKADETKRTESVNTEAADKSLSAGIQFKCDLCNFESASDKGVRQHFRLKHKISQLDGQDDCEAKSSASESEKNPCPLCPDNSVCCATDIEFSQHVMTDHEPNDVFKHFGIFWIIDHIPNIEYAQDPYHLQKWKSFIAEMQETNLK